MKALDETRTPLAGTALQGLDRLASAAGPSGSARLASIVRKCAEKTLSELHDLANR